MPSLGQLLHRDVSKYTCTPAHTRTSLATCPALQTHTRIETTPNPARISLGRVSPWWRQADPILPGLLLWGPASLHTRPSTTAHVWLPGMPRPAHPVQKLTPHLLRAVPESGAGAPRMVRPSPASGTHTFSPFSPEPARLGILSSRTLGQPGKAWLQKRWPRTPVGWPIMGGPLPNPHPRLPGPCEKDSHRQHLTPRVSRETPGANRWLFLGQGGQWATVLTPGYVGWGAQPGRSGLWLLDSVVQGPGKGAKNSRRQLSPHYIWQRDRRL